MAPVKTSRATHALTVACALAVTLAVAARPSSAARPVPEAEIDRREMSAISTSAILKTPPPPHKTAPLKKKSPPKMRVYTYPKPIAPKHMKFAMAAAATVSGCTDLSSYCAKWGAKYCNPVYAFQGKLVGAYWCRRSCKKCKPSPSPRKTSPPPRKGTATSTVIAPRTLRPPPPRSLPSNPPTPLTSSSNAEYQFQLLALVNQGRADNGKSPLCLNMKLSAAAQAHSESMSAKGFFSHVGLDGSQPWDRMTRAGYGFQGYEAENIAKGYPDAQSVYLGWKNSPGHWANILGPYRHMGVGLVNKIWTQDFGSNPSEKCYN